MTGPTFGSPAYRKLIKSLDDIVEDMKSDFGKSEKGACDWLADFVVCNYLPVWRRMKLRKRRNGESIAFTIGTK